MKVYRGISKTTGSHSFMLGKGLYTTRDRKYAQEFAGPDGQVLELDAEAVIPSCATPWPGKTGWIRQS